MEDKKDGSKRKYRKFPSFYGSFVRSPVALAVEKIALLRCFGEVELSAHDWLRGQR